MIELSKNEKEKIIEYTAEALAQFSDQTDAIKILADIYCNNMPYAPAELGEAVAKEIVTVMSAFYQNCKYADSPEYIRDRISESVSVFPDNKSAEILENAKHLFNSFGSIFKGNQTKNGEIVQTQLQTQELIVQTAESIIEQQDKISLDELEKFYDEYDSGTSYLQQLHGEEMSTAVLALIIYTMAKNGELSELPTDVTLRQVVLAVCADTEMYKTVRFCKEGDIKEEKAESNKRKIIKGFLLSLFTVSLLSVLPGTILTAGFISAVVLGCRCLFKVGKIKSECNDASNLMLEDSAEDIRPVNLELDIKQMQDVYPIPEQETQTENTDIAENAEEEIINLQTEKAREKQ